MTFSVDIVSKADRMVKDKNDLISDALESNLGGNYFNGADPDGESQPELI